MSSWSKIVSSNIPKEITPVVDVKVTPKIERKITPVISVSGKKLTKREECVRRKLISYFKYRLPEFDSEKDGYISIDEAVFKMNSGQYSINVYNFDITSLVSNSYGKDFEFHPTNRNMICHVLSKR